MAGRRMISENVCTSKKLTKVSAEAERLWFRLLTRVDDNGNFHGGAAEVRGACLPCFDVTLAQTESWLKELNDVRGQGEEDPHGLIAFYEVHGERFAHFIGFEKHQTLRKDRTMSIKFPLHPENMVLVGDTAQENDEELEKPRDFSGLPSVSPVVTVLTPTGMSGDIPRYGVSKDKVSKDKRSEDKSNTDSTSFSSMPTAQDRKSMRILYGRMSGGKHIGGKQFDIDLDKACEKYSFDIIMICLSKWLESRKGNPKAFTYSYPLRWFFSDELPMMAEIEQTLLDDVEDQKRADTEAAEQRAHSEQVQAESIERQTQETVKFLTSQPPAIIGEGSVEDFLAGE